MLYSRTGIVAVLLAAEAVIAGGILTQASALHPEQYEGRAAASFDSGLQPHVVVDDPSSRVVVEVSHDGRVHVADQTRSFGLRWTGSGATPPSDLRIERTSDGVFVHRLSGASGFQIFGVESDRVVMSVPPGAFVDVRGCDGADIAGLRANSIAVNCQDGSLHMNDLAVGSGSLRTADGSIHLQLAASDLTVHARTGDGSVHFNGRRISGDDSAEGTFQLGSGSGRLDVATQDGSIRITTTSGVQ